MIMNVPRYAPRAAAASPPPCASATCATGAPPFPACCARMPSDANSSKTAARGVAPSTDRTPRVRWRGAPSPAALAAAHGPTAAPVHPRLREMLERRVLPQQQATCQSYTGPAASPSMRPVSVLGHDRLGCTLVDGVMVDSDGGRQTVGRAARANRRRVRQDRRLSRHGRRT